MKAIPVLFLLTAGCWERPVEQEPAWKADVRAIEQAERNWVDPVVGDWAPSKKACRTAPIKITKGADINAKYLLQGAGVSCFLDYGMVVDFGGNTSYPARCRTSDRSKEIRYVKYNVNDKGRVALVRHKTCTFLAKCGGADEDFAWARNSCQVNKKALRSE